MAHMMKKTNTLLHQVGLFQTGSLWIILVLEDEDFFSIFLFSIANLMFSRLLAAGEKVDRGISHLERFADRHLHTIKLLAMVIEPVVILHCCRYVIVVEVDALEVVEHIEEVFVLHLLLGRMMQELHIERVLIIKAYNPVSKVNEVLQFRIANCRFNWLHI